MLKPCVVSLCHDIPSQWAFLVGSLAPAKERFAPPEPWTDPPEPQQELGLLSSFSRGKKRLTGALLEEQRRRRAGAANEAMHIRRKCEIVP